MNLIYLIRYLIVVILFQSNIWNIHSTNIYIKNKKSEIYIDNIVVGANQTTEYLDNLKGKNIGIVANHTSVIFKNNTNYTHLVDSLLSLRMNIKKIFTPEHGYKGENYNGENVPDDIDKNTGISIISLHGKEREYGKISDDDLIDIDVMIFDIQDVGTRFYTHISTLHYVMEACARNNIPLLVFDRPNPNGSYIDGPVLEEENKSFVGMHPVPIVYGMTIGEYSLMINGEGWLNNNLKIVFHCFTGSEKLLNFCIQNNYYISLSGIITFNNSIDLVNTVSKIPIKNLLIETDSPYLTPSPNRGKSNEPSYLIHTLNKLSEIKEISKEEVMKFTTNNFNKLFNIN